MFSPDEKRHYQTEKSIFNHHDHIALAYISQKISIFPSKNFLQIAK